MMLLLVLVLLLLVGLVLLLPPLLPLFLLFMFLLLRLLLLLLGGRGRRGGEEGGGGLGRRVRSSMKYTRTQTTYGRHRGSQGVGGGGRTHLLLALIIGPLTTHPFRDGAPFLLLLKTLPTFGRSVRFFHIPIDTYLVRLFCLSYLLLVWPTAATIYHLR